MTESRTDRLASQPRPAPLPSLHPTPHTPLPPRPRPGRRGGGGRQSISDSVHSISEALTAPIIPCSTPPLHLPPGTGGGGGTSPWRLSSRNGSGGGDIKVDPHRLGSRAGAGAGAGAGGTGVAVGSDHPRRRCTHFRQSCVAGKTGERTDQGVAPVLETLPAGTLD